MDNDVLLKVSQDMAKVDIEIARAKDLTSALKEAGENVTELESKMKTLEKRKTKWQNMLDQRGL